MNAIPGQFKLEQIRPRSDDASARLSVFDFDALFAGVRRQRLLIIACALIGVVAAGVYAFRATPLYTAMTKVLLDNSRVRALKDVDATIDPVLDTAAVDTQIEILRSNKIALDVVRRFNLHLDPEFVQSPSYIRQALRWLVPSEPEVRDETFLREQAAVATFLNRTGVKRAARTYVIEVTFTSSDPAKASRIANGIASAFLNDQLDAKFDATRRASGWLQERIEDLRRRALEADTAVQDFRARNGLITAAGKLVTEQQVTEMNTQLTTVRADVARAEARYRRIQAIIDSRNPEAAVSETIENPIIARLRNQYLDASKQESELGKRLGPNHVVAVNLRSEMKQYERLMFEELGRIAESYRSDFQIAASRERALEDNLRTAVGANAADNATLVQLRELERASETYRVLYQNFLQRHQETLQQQSLPITDARVVTGATEPSIPSFPRKPLLMALGLVAGGLVGAGFGFVREYRDRVFRTGNHVRDELDLELLGYLPNVGDAASSEGSELAEGAGAKDAARRSILRYAVDEPLSLFTETLRAVKVAADIKLSDRRPKIIGMVSVLPDEGKSTTSKNLASLLAHLGSRTLLIDGDLRNPGLTRSISKSRAVGLSDILTQEAKFEDTIQTEPDTGLDFIPIGSKRHLPHTSELLSSAAMRGLLQRAADGGYDYVVVDLPPLGPVVDVRAAASLFDGFVLVVEWGATPRAVVRGAMEQDRPVQDRCLGVVLNKVDLGKINLYEGLDSKTYYYPQYKEYFRKS
jgi:succinoglycan biosynthesis transport protein ExoP